VSLDLVLDETMKGALVAAGGFLAVVIAYTIYHRRRVQRYINLTSEELVSHRPVRERTGNFLIYNYFPNHSVVLDIIEYSSTNPDGNVVRLVDKIKPLSTGSLTKLQVREYLKAKNIIRISVIAPTGEFKRFSDYEIDTDNQERIKNLHIGMITTRYIGSTDSLRMSTVAGNAVSGNAFLRIHNTTYIPLQLNEEDVSVAPHSTDRYLGYRHQGVTLGTIFSDPSGLYPDFQYLEPHTDLYYGVVSDLRQPISGCWQLEYSDQCEYGQTMWPFQTGVM